MEEVSKSMKDKQINELEKRIPYESEKYGNYPSFKQYLENLLNDSTYIALSTLFPFVDSYEDIELPAKYSNWVVRAAVEIHKWQGNQGVKSYTETGLSWTRANDGVLPNAMLDELESPRVGVPKRRDDNDNQ